MESISFEGDVVIDGLGLDDEMIGNNFFNFYKCKLDSGLGFDGGVSGGVIFVVILKSLGYCCGFCCIVLMVNLLRYVDFFEK